jgi:hypothetical protein
VENFFSKEPSQNTTNYKGLNAFNDKWKHSNGILIINLLFLATTCHTKSDGMDLSTYI